MEQKIRDLIKKSMLEKNKNAQLTYKSILENAQKYAKADGNRNVTDDDFVKAAKNEIKQLKDLLEYCEVSSDKYFEITHKIDYCVNILPAMATEEDIINYLVSNNIDKNIGVCMKSLKEHFGSNMDGKMANGIVRKYIG